MDLSIHIDDEKLIRKMQEVQVVCGKAVEDSLVVGAGIAAREFIRATWPKSQEQGETAIRTQVNRAYARAGEVFEDMKNAGHEKPAAKFYAYAKRASFHDRAEALVRQFSPKFGALKVQPFDGGSAHKAMRNRRGRVAENRKPAFIVGNDSALKKYVESKVKLAGFTAGAWANCTSILKNRDGGIPRFVARHKGKSLGTVDFRFGGDNPFVRINNRVRWSAIALAEGTERHVAKVARGKLYQYLWHTLHHKLNPRNG